MFKNCISLSSIPKINLLKAADMTDFIKGCISLKLSIVLPEAEYINEEEINILDNNFYSLIEPNRKEIYKIVYDKILESTKNSFIAYKCAWLARNNDNFVVDFFIKKLEKLDIRKSIVFRYINYLQKNKYNTDSNALWNAGFILNNTRKDSSDSDYDFISEEDEEGIEKDNSENYTKEIEYF